MMPLAETIREQFEIEVFTPANFEFAKIPIPAAAAPVISSTQQSSSSGETNGKQSSSSKLTTLELSDSLIDGFNESSKQQ